jgi:hypothetical protein
MDNKSGQWHGTSCQAGDINTVIVRDSMYPGGSIDMVRGQPGIELRDGG